MEDLTTKVGQLRDAWEASKTILHSNPAWWTPHSQYLSMEQIDEAIGALAELTSKLKVPSGFKPNFHLAHAATSCALTQSTTHLNAVRSGAHNQLPNFITSLGQSLASINSMLTFGGKHDGRQAIMELASELAQNLALLDTAQRELSQKAGLLAQASKLADEIESGAKKVEEHESELQNILDKTNKSVSGLIEETAKKMKSLSTQADESAEVASKTLKDKREELEAHETEWEAANGRFKNLMDRCEKNVSGIEQQREASKQLQDTNEKHQKLIEALLPKGASAALAAGFESRAVQMESTKRVWMTTFIVSIVGLLVVAGWLARETTNPGSQDTWLVLIQRLPFAAPLIWLGWFSAIQYGNTIRVQEDYAFKAATSKAFAGYKDHMDHMASVKLEDANSAMLLLAQRTIEILSHEPLRLYGKTDKDVSPANQLTKLFERREKQEDK